MQFSSKILLFFAVSIILILNNSCGKQLPKITPAAYGQVDHVMVVASDDLWNGLVRDTFNHFFQALYPVTPTPEPLFDVRHVKPMDFNEVLKTRRSIIIMADLDDEDSYASQLVRNTLNRNQLEKAKTDKDYCMAVHKDRWADGQMIIYWFSYGSNNLIKNIAKYHRAVMRQFNEADLVTLTAQSYFRGEDEPLQKELSNGLNVNLKIPLEYFKGNLDDSTMWVRKETNELSSDIFVAVLDYDTEISPENHTKIRNELTKKYFSTKIEDSYMEIENRIIPVYYKEDYDLNGAKALQARGLWRMVNDFMGGSFVSYMIKDEKRKRVLFLDGFVHYPAGQKRPEMRKLDVILSTLKI